MSLEQLGLECGWGKHEGARHVTRMPNARPEMVLVIDRAALTHCGFVACCCVKSSVQDSKYVNMNIRNSLSVIDWGISSDGRALA